MVSVVGVCVWPLVAGPRATPHPPGAVAGPATARRSAARNRQPAAQPPPPGTPGTEQHRAGGYPAGRWADRGPVPKCA